jgi:hypothetical protein
MSRRKQASLRRWKARCRLGRPIPAWAVVEHRLNRWFKFVCADWQRDYSFAIETTP